MAESDLVRERTEEPRRPPFNGPTYTETLSLDGVPYIRVWYATHSLGGKDWSIIIDVDVCRALKSTPRSDLTGIVTDVIQSLNTPNPIVYPCARKLLRRVEPLYLRPITANRIGLERIKFTPNGTLHAFSLLRHALP